MALTATLGLACAGDAAPIARLSRDAVEAGLIWSWTPRRVLGSIANRDTSVVVARRDRSLDGFAIMSFGETRAHLNLLAVDPGQRRRGLGTRLLDWLRASALEAGVFLIELEVREGNGGALAFYERHGFSRSGRSPGYYQGVESALHMRCDLAGRR